MSKSHLSKIKKILSNKTTLTKEQLELIEHHFEKMSSITDISKEDNSEDEDKKTKKPKLNRQEAFDAFIKYAKLAELAEYTIKLTPEELLPKGIVYNKSFESEEQETKAQSIGQDSDVNSLDPYLGSNRPPIDMTPIDMTPIDMTPIDMTPIDDKDKKEGDSVQDEHKIHEIHEIHEIKDDDVLNHIQPDDIRSKVNLQVNEYIIDQFNKANDYKSKNRVLLKMSNLYNITRDSSQLEVFMGDMPQNNSTFFGGKGGVVHKQGRVVHKEGKKHTVFPMGDSSVDADQTELESAPDIDWNLCFKILSGLATVAGGGMLVVGLLLPVPGLAIAGACLLAAGVAGYATSQQDSEGEKNDDGLAYGGR
ncbi:MAG: hypothetical protein GW760_01565 [Legionella sp.]|nr:hypothetical protein [Legionella sp.]